METTELSTESKNQTRELVEIKKLLIVMIDKDNKK